MFCQKVPDGGLTFTKMQKCWNANENGERTGTLFLSEEEKWSKTAFSQKRVTPAFRIKKREKNTGQRNYIPTCWEIPNNTSALRNHTIAPALGNHPIMHAGPAVGKSSIKSEPERLRTQSRIEKELE